MATLAEIRAKLLAQDNKASENSSANRGSDAVYPFWNMDNDNTSVLRFLPDSDPTNTFFWKERQVIKLPFPGVKGGDETKRVIVQVPCVEMWGESCPIHAEIRPWFKDPSMEDLGRTYWKKRSYVFQGLVVTDPIGGEQPENPVRRFIIGPQIFKLLKAALMDPDMDNLPTDYEQGTDFRLTKTQKGQYADYSTSSWSRKERSLNEEERKIIETHGLFNLNEFMPKRPTEDDMKVIKEMFEASVDGELYDPTRWGQHYKPYGLDVPAGTSTPKTATPTPKVEEVKEEKVATATPTPTPTPTSTPAPATAQATTDAPKADAADILAMIRSRKTD